MKTTVILGAGFSKNSGIPLESEIPELLINSNEENACPSTSKVIEYFYRDIFGYTGDGIYPDLQDILTSIDISITSSHYLGLKYPPSQIETVRKIIVYRMFQLLEKKFEYSKDIEKLLISLTNKYEEVNFVVLNWDTVLEKYLCSMNMWNYDYCNEGETLRLKESIYPQIKLLKPHGSTNWLYCNNCRSIINDKYDDVPIIKKIDLEIKEWEALFKKKEDFPEKKYECIFCGNEMKSHIATLFSRKSFRAKSFPMVWNGAEKVLSQSEKWVFIGYSLPDADYEFKHMLKICQLKYRHISEKNVNIDIVLLNSKDTPKRYRSFFGDSINLLCNEGIVKYMDYI